MWAFDSDQASYGAGEALIHVPGYAAGKPGATVYFACADCAVELERAIAAGGRAHRPKTSIEPYGFLALVEDLEKNTIGLYSTEVTGATPARPYRIHSSTGADSP